ncbi:MAG TPA: hypothetical protein VKE22_16665 [Haliangiales bacterium]|nr:hypothetical protein [Haliangiales bacterium]
MYDRVVDVPRLVASLPADGPVHPLLERARELLAARYGEEFPRISLALYRDGDDSVAYHGDTTARDLREALVATVSSERRGVFSSAPPRGADRWPSRSVGAICS